MEDQIKSAQVCRLCLESEVDNGSFLVEIFSTLINDSWPGKIRELFGLKISPKDGLPSLVCHKCLVVTENCMEFRDKCLKNDEKLRLWFKVTESAEEAQEPELQLSVPEAPAEPEFMEEEEEEVITLNPNKLYESSDESEAEVTDQLPAEPVHVQFPPTTAAVTEAATNPRPVKPSDPNKKEIFHCRYCDVVFSDSNVCQTHERSTHDQAQPYECIVCSFKTDQHPTLIFHIKQTHNLDKPFLCTQCSKSYNRRSDLRKHTFAHAGIRLYSCDICKKSFTRNTNLTKHKRTHNSEAARTWKCQLCPRAFYTNSELLRHMEIHMDRKSLQCKHCNQAFTRRDQLEIHQKTHFENHSQQIELPPPIQQFNPVQVPPIMFYNQPIEIAQTPLNFYTENTNSYTTTPTNGGALQAIQPKKEYPIMNQLLTGMSLNHLQQNFAVKNFVCGICNNSFFKRKELDRHVMTIHTSVKKFKCEQCAKEFNRKDKLLRHEKIHLTTIFNCPNCPAVFVRKQMLDFHSKIHEVGNGEHGNFMANLQPVLPDMNGCAGSMNYEANRNCMTEFAQPLVQDAPVVHHMNAAHFPMNLSFNKNLSEPMNLSNEKVNHFSLEPITKITIISDEEDNGLQIVEDNTLTIKKSPSSTQQNPPEDAPIITEQSFDYQKADIKPKFEFPIKNLADISFPSRLPELDKLEPLKDLPMEILNND